MTKKIFLAPPVETVRTPSVHSRADAWLAWESSLLGNRNVTKPHGTFAKRWHNTKAFLFKFDLVKKNTGVIKYTNIDGRECEVNLLEKRARLGFVNLKESTFNVDYWLYKVFINENEYPAMAAAQKWIIKTDRLWRKELYNSSYRLRTHQGFVGSNIIPTVSYKDVVLFSKYPEVFDAGWYEWRLHPEEEEMSAGWWTDDGFVRLDLKHGKGYCFWILDGIVADNLYSMLTAIEYYREHPEDKPLVP